MGVAGLPLLESALPNLCAYWPSLKDRPSYRTAIVDWHDEVNWRSAVREVFGESENPLLGLLLNLLDA